MKKTIYFALVAISMLTVSCKKEYTCDCVYTTTQTAKDDNGEDLMEPQTSVTKQAIKIKEKKSEAKTKCEGSNGDIVQTTNSGDFNVKQTVNTNCTLK